MLISVCLTPKRSARRPVPSLPTMEALPGGMEKEALAKLVKGARRASDEARPMTDDRSDLDYLESPFCVRWRRLIWEDMPGSVLGD